MITDLDITVRSLYPHLDTAEHFIIGMLTEEAGEVQGAYNKARRMNVPSNKRTYTDDIVEELIQLYACALLAGHHYGFSSEQMNELAIRFMQKKESQIKEEM